MSVKKRGISIVFLAMLTTALLSSTILLAEDTEGETVRLEGFVSVLRDANDAIISVQLVTDESIYKVELNEKGLGLGEEMEYEKVEVEGIVSEKDEQKWLKVLKFKAIEEEQ